MKVARKNYVTPRKVKAKAAHVSSNPRYVCNYCKAVFATLEDLGQHLKGHQIIQREAKNPSAVLRKVPVCIRCDMMVFKTKKRCEEHILEKHQSDLAKARTPFLLVKKLILCKLCTIVFASEAELKLHEDKEHPSDHVKESQEESDTGNPKN